MPRCKRGRAILLGLVLGAGAILIAPAVSARPGGRAVYHLQFEGVVNPLSARYLARGIANAEHDQAAALVFQIDTPGGLDGSMREMVEYILNADVPVIVYVAPAGARAASAGMFITVAGHIAAMAPGTNIGAAHPVPLGGGQQDATMLAKVEEDAAAYARSVAKLRDHNPEWAERAVRQSVSITAEEARDLGVIDVIAPNLTDLLAQVNGRKVETNAGPVLLDVEGAPIRDLPMTVLEKLLHMIAEPNIAYILLTVGMIGLIAEMYHPGGIFPGVAGTISLLLGLTALGMLPVGWAGVALLALAMGLFIAETFVHGFGVLGAGAIVSFILGSLLLFVPVSPVSPAMPAVRVSPWLVGLMSAILLGGIILLFRVRMAMWRKPAVFGAEALVGRLGVARSELDPFGTVRVDSEVWRAEARQTPVKRGETVRVAGLEGVTLVVERVAAETPDSPPS
ncbi:MAG TPA: nodulation protein NfeD [Armatimonadota bacterium]|nr:nodulation protein NfeD [Armatimonadota bacterium]